MTLGAAPRRTEVAQAGCEGQSFGIATPRRYGAVNWLGLWSHYRRGLLRFFDYAWETVGGPCVFTLMFLAVFVVAFGPEAELAPGLSYATFVAPGLILFSTLHSAFSMTAFPVMDEKQNRSIEDLLTAPLSPAEVMAGYVLTGVTSGLVNGLVAGLIVSVFVDLPMPDLLPMAAFMVLGALLFALFGALVGLWGDKWEQYSFADSLVVMPLGLLSATFYPIGALPELGQRIIVFNPVFYAVDGFRGAFLEQADTVAWQGALLLGVLSLILLFGVHRLFARGYKIKS